MQLAENGGNVVTVNFIKNTFEFNKPSYHCRIVIVDKLGQLTLNYTLRPVSGAHMVCGCFNNAYYYNKYNWSDYFYLFDGFNISSNTWNRDNVTVEVTDVGTHTYSILQAGSIGITGSMVQLPQNDVTITIDADFPIFAMDSTTSEDGTGGSYVRFANTNFNTYESEIKVENTEHINLAVNYKNVINEIPSDHIWTIRCNLKKNGSFVSGTNKAYDFKIQPDARIWLVYTDRLNGDASPNFILHLNKSPWLQKNAYAPDSTYAETSSLDTDYWWGNWQDYDTGDSYTGIASTNIPIFDSDEKGDAYGRGEIGIDEALNGGDTSFSRSTIGNDLSASDIPTVNLAVSGCGSYIYALSSSDLKDVMSNYVYTTDETLQGNIQGGLWLWGNNPADFIIDLYYIPFAITNFYDTINANLKFGTYQIPDTTYSAVKEANGNRITLFNTTFEGIYGDWRDFTQFDYELFLPFKGFVTLDVYKILNRTVRCEMMFDITTHNIRYYLFADDVIIERFDASVGVNMPIMASDMVNKAKAEHEATLGAVKSGANAVGGLIGNGAKLFAGDVVGGVTGLIQTSTNAVIDGIKTYDTFASHETQSVQGSFSSSMNIYDITYAYIKITERGLIIPDKLHTLYNYPSYYMGKASALSGYCEISDIRLNGFTGTKDEAIALKNDLKEGVIL